MDDVVFLDQNQNHKQNDDDDDEERVDFECHKEEKRARSIPIILSYAQHYRAHSLAFLALIIYL